MDKKNIKTESLLLNKKALFDYELIRQFEASMELLGHEVKSIKAGHINLKGSFITIREGTLFVQKFHVSPYTMLPNKTIVDPLRERKLFLHKSDILFLDQKLKEKGFTLIPVEVYLKGNLIKMRIALAKGKKLYEKKQVMKEREIDKQAKIDASKFLR
ncbi:MAG: SsrA-binding protein SmpB [Candidatus Gracilibacteria bacterium]|nr:SsrA-binding protein SmpB [Candidatus Gracilibacteria bacterium]